MKKTMKRKTLMQTGGMTSPMGGMTSMMRPQAVNAGASVPPSQKSTMGMMKGGMAKKTNKKKK